MILDHIRGLCSTKEMKINHKLLPIKAHFFFFMAAMGPILPQLPVFGRELGISSVVMGSITGILPIVFLFAKPLFGILVDVYREYRKSIFMLVIIVMGLSFALLNFVPPQPEVRVNFTAVDGTAFIKCSDKDINTRDQCDNTTRIICNSECFRQPEIFFMNSSNSKICYFGNITIDNATGFSYPCGIRCTKDIEYDSRCLYKSISFWGFVVLMSLGSVGFNVVNSISDAICFDVIGEDHDYGKQRVWGTIGFGVSALIAGYTVDFFSGTAMKYSPAIVVMIACCSIDLLSCTKLKLPIMKAPDNIFKSIKDLLKNKHVAAFLIFAVFAGFVDSFIIYYLFWYLEDLAEATGTENVKLLEGLIVAAETLGGEVIFFSISGKILERFGHVHCFSMCFINYALRLGFISMVSSPWWIVPIEFIFQGPTYALTYTTIVAYANELAPPGASATMQGIAAGMDDGFDSQKILCFDVISTDVCQMRTTEIHEQQKSSSINDLTAIFIQVVEILVPSQTVYKFFAETIEELFHHPISTLITTIVDGYAIGSFVGGILYKYLGGRNAMQVFSIFGVICSIAHLLLHKTVLRHRETSDSNGHVEYNHPDVAIKVVDS